MLLNMYAIIDKLDEFKAFFKKYEDIRMPFEIMGGKFNRKVKILSNMAIAIVIMNYGVALLCFVLLFSSYEYLNRKSYVRLWICNNIPGKCWLKLFILCNFDFVAGSVMISSPTLMFYFGINAIFGLMSIHEFVKDICSSKIPRAEWYTSELYQNLVEQKLKICVMMHDQTLRQVKSIK